jgi:hypothetical protein
MQRHLWEPQPYARKPAGKMPNLTQSPTPPLFPRRNPLRRRRHAGGIADFGVSFTLSPPYPPRPPPP